MLTAIAGSSYAVDRGFITYTREAESEMPEVPSELIEALGALRKSAAQRMAESASEGSPADIVVSVTGVAGPGGGSPAMPVGLAWFGLAARPADAQQTAGGSRRPDSGSHRDGAARILGDPRAVLTVAG